MRLELSTELRKDNWETAYAICHHTVNDNEIIWLQYRVLNRISGTNILRFAMKLTDNNKCRLCRSQKESLSHLSFFCDKTIFFCIID